MAYLWRDTYEKPHCVINVLYIAFWAFVMNCENQELIWLKFPKFPSFINSINSKGNIIVDGKLVRSAIPGRVCFWHATRETLQTPDLKLTAGCLECSGSQTVFDRVPPGVFLMLESTTWFQKNVICSNVIKITIAHKRISNISITQEYIFAKRLVLCDTCNNRLA